MMKTDVFKKMAESWPSSIVARNRVEEFTGGLISPGTLANHDSNGTGPEHRILLGRRKVGYPKDSLISWLRDRSEIVGGRDIL